MLVVSENKTGIGLDVHGAVRSYPGFQRRKNQGVDLKIWHISEKVEGSQGCPRTAILLYLFGSRQKTDNGTLVMDPAIHLEKLGLCMRGGWSTRDRRGVMKPQSPPPWGLSFSLFQAFSKLWKLNGEKGQVRRQGAASLPNFTC